MPFTRMGGGSGWVVEGSNKYTVSFEEPADQLEFNLDDLRPHWDWLHGRWVRPQSKSGKQIKVGRRVEVSFEGVDQQGAWFPATIEKCLENGEFLVYSNSMGEAIKATVDALHVRPCPPLVRGKKEFMLQAGVEAFFNFAWRSGVITTELENGSYSVFLRHVNVDKEFDQSELRARVEWNDGEWQLSDENCSLSPSSDKRRLCHSDPGAAPKKQQQVGNAETSVGSEGNFPKMLEGIRSKSVARNVKGRLAKEGREELVVEVEYPIASLCKEEEKEDCEIVEIDEESVLKCIHEMDSVTAFDGSTLPPLKQCSTRNNSTVQSEMRALPFEKTADLWQIIESVEVLQRFPQNPHFQPLEQEKVGLREGLAIGHMVNFSNLVKQTSKLQVNDPKSSMDEIMEALQVLETHGFDVSAIQEHVTELLIVKDREEKLLDEANNLKDRILVQRREKDGIVEAITELQEQKRKLEEKLLVLESAQMNVDEEIASLQAGVEETERKIKNGRAGLKVML